MNKIILIFLCLCITLNLYTQDVTSLENEYKELIMDIWSYGPNVSIPYYTNLQYYNYADRYTVDVDADDVFAFAIIGAGFVKFIEEPQGSVIYSRYLWLRKSEEGYFYGPFGRCADDFYETDIDGVYLITAYLPEPGTRIERIFSTIKMDAVIPVEVPVIPRKLNTSMVDLVYTVNRMIEIAYTLKQLQPEFLHLYEFKIRTLEIILNYVIEDRYEFDREYRRRFENNQQITQRDFYEMHPHLMLINEMLPFLELDR